MVHGCNQALLEEKTSRCKEKSEKIAQGLVQQKEASAEEAKLTAQQIEERLVAAEKNRLEQNEKELAKVKQMNARVEEAQEKMKAKSAHDMSATEAKIQSADDRRQLLIQSTQEKCAAEVAKVQPAIVKVKILNAVLAALRILIIAIIVFTVLIPTQFLSLTKFGWV
jgi:Fe2+ transport system protein B